MTQGLFFYGQKFNCLVSPSEVHMSNDPCGGRHSYCQILKIQPYFGFVLGFVCLFVCLFSFVFRIKSQNCRVSCIEGKKGTQITYFQSPWHGQEHLSLDHIAQSPIQHLNSQNFILHFIYKRNPFRQKVVIESQKV